MDRFYLGTDRGHWLRTLEDVPLFVSRVTLDRYKKNLPRATTRWALDSGGFTELDRHGGWTLSPHRYAAKVRRYSDEIGMLDWAAPQDWMCEPHMLANTGLTVADHQRLTTDNYLDLITIWPDGPFIPVLQGWTRDDYLRHVDQYASAGVDLSTQETVGLGSVCRRQALGPAFEIVSSLHPIRIHGFGMKTDGIHEYGALLASADSMAWSYAGRLRPDPECPKTTCNHCLHYALEWRLNVIRPRSRPKLWAASSVAVADPKEGQ